MSIGSKLRRDKNKKEADKIQLQVAQISQTCMNELQVILNKYDCGIEVTHQLKIIPHNIPGITNEKPDQQQELPPEQPSNNV